MPLAAKPPKTTVTTRIFSVTTAPRTAPTERRSVARGRPVTRKKAPTERRSVARGRPVTRKKAPTERRSVAPGLVPGIKASENPEAPTERRWPPIPTATSAPVGASSPTHAHTPGQAPGLLAFAPIGAATDLDFSLSITSASEAWCPRHPGESQHRIRREASQEAAPAPRAPSCRATRGKPRSGLPPTAAGARPCDRESG